jgi:transcription-repair coupling factor (superfamily II helicase)
VRELKGEDVPLEIHSALNLALDIRIPTEYIADENQRLRAYRRIASARDAADRDQIEKELADRYGSLPEAVRNLLEYSSLKTIAETLGIERIDRRNGALQIKFHPDTRVDATRLMNLVSRDRESQFTPAGLLRLPLDGKLGPAAVLAHVRDRLNELQG